MSNEKGQSTIEFIFAFAFGVSIIFLVFNSAINYATGYVIHYATFMASRTYLTTDPQTGSMGQMNLNGAEDKARATFNRYNLSFLKVKNLQFRVNAPDQSNPASYLTVGTVAQFDQSIDVVGKLAGQKVLNLVSESFLGREPTRVECASRVCMAITGSEVCTENLDITLYDDGC